MIYQQNTFSGDVVENQVKLRLIEFPNWKAIVGLATGNHVSVPANGIGAVLGPVNHRWNEITGGLTRAYDSGGCELPPLDNRIRE